MRTLNIIILSMIGFSAQAQMDTLIKPSKVISKIHRKQIDLLYLKAHTDHNLSFNYNHYFGRHGIVVGVHYHFNTKVTSSKSRFDNFTFRKEGTSRIGLNLGYKFELLKPGNYRMLHPYLFYQLQFMPSRSAQRTYLDTNAPGGTGQITVTTQPYTIFENSIGLGVNTKLFQKFHFNGSVGYGIVTFISEGVTFSPKRQNVTENFFLLRGGLSYQIR